MILKANRFSGSRDPNAGIPLGNVAAGDASLCGKELENHVSNPFLLPRFKMGIHRQRENLRRHPLRHREIPFFVAQICIGPLKMKGYRVVNLRRDPRLSKMSLDLIAISDANYI